LLVLTSINITDGFITISQAIASLFFIDGVSICITRNKLLKFVKKWLKTINNLYETMVKKVIIVSTIQKLESKTQNFLKHKKYVFYSLSKNCLILKTFFSISL